MSVEVTAETGMPVPHEPDSGKKCPAPAGSTTMVIRSGKPGSTGVFRTALRDRPAPLAVVELGNAHVPGTAEIIDAPGGRKYEFPAEQAGTRNLRFVPQRPYQPARREVTFPIGVTG